MTNLHRFEAKVKSEKKKEQMTSIGITFKTKKKLEEVCPKSMSFDEFLNKLLDEQK